MKKFFKKFLKKFLPSFLLFLLFLRLSFLSIDSAVLYEDSGHHLPEGKVMFIYFSVENILEGIEQLVNEANFKEGENHKLRSCASFKEFLIAGSTNQETSPWGPHKKMGFICTILPKPDVDEIKSSSDMVLDFHYYFVFEHKVVFICDQPCPPKIRDYLDREVLPSVFSGNIPESGRMLVILNKDDVAVIFKKMARANSEMVSDRFLDELEEMGNRKIREHIKRK